VDTWQLAESKVIEMMERAQTVQQAMRDQEAQNQAQALEGIAQVTSAMEGLETAIKETETTLINLDSLLAQQRALSIDVTGALPGLTMVRDYLVEINRLQGLAVVPTVEGASGLSSFASSPVVDEETAPITSFATGTNYVPRTGPYLLHQGEAVIPASRNPGNSGQSVSISFGNIVIHGADKNAREIAREIAPAVREELKKIEAKK